MQVDLVRRGLGIAVVAQGCALAVPAATGAAGPAAIAAGAVFGLVCDVLLVRALRRGATPQVGIANGITWARCALVGAVVALVAAAAHGLGTVELVVIAAVALVLDGVDGRVARATRTVSALGSRFDMEVDAALVLALSVAAVPRVGPWVLLVGAARYLLLLATLQVPRLGAPTPPKLWRKVVAAVQGVVLTVLCAEVLDPPIGEGIAVVAALALAWSFGTQVRSLLGVRAHPRPAVPEPADARLG